MDFADLARPHLGFLIEMGFVETRADEHGLAFGRGDVELSILCYPARIEFDVNLECRGVRCSLNDILGVDHESPPWKDLQRQPCPRDTQSVERVMSLLAEILSTLCEPALQGDAKLYAQVAAECEVRRRRWVQEQAASDFRPRAERAFKEKRYAEAAELYGKIDASMLEPSEIAKLTYAKKHARQLGFEDSTSGE